MEKETIILKVNAIVYNSFLQLMLVPYFSIEVEFQCTNIKNTQPCMNQWMGFIVNIFERRNENENVSVSFFSA